MNYSNLELNIKTRHHNFKNCFLHLNKKYKDILNENDIVQLKTYNNQISKAYFSILFTNIGKKDDDCVFIDRLYGNKLDLNDDEEALMIKCNNDIKFAHSIIIQPVSNDDWQILELNIDNIQNNLLNQIKVVFKDQIFPIWIETNVSIFVTVSK
jgi:16S rRNA G966 N2-methylase RsmD